MYSVSDDLTAGFPHSEICGSKLVCQLPAAYRKLLRPSSPDIAKASTMCTYSLVPITLTSAGATRQRRYRANKHCVAAHLCADKLKDRLVGFDTIITHQSFQADDLRHRFRLTEQ